MRRGLTLLAAVLLTPGAAVFAHGGEKHKAVDADSAALAAEQTEWGIAGDPQAVSRTVAIEMSDQMRFTPALIEVRRGETLRLRLHNAGKLMHEMVIGTKAVLDEHAAMMARYPNMEHDAAYMAHVPPGDTGEIVWNFNRAGQFDFACLIAGHYAAGMVGRIEVAGQ